MGFGGTITSGIQDVSALLPLLGTEQCEDHVGSALVSGYLYASAAPLSIFGSLGIVRAGFKALAASVVVITRERRFMGAEKLKNAGFGPTGDALSQIMWKDKCHVAETQLTARLEELHITDVENLTVEADSSLSSWNWRMIGCSFIAVVLSITPYVYLIKNNDDAWVERLFYPLARSIGSALVSNTTQIIIQARLLEIIKHRLVFMSLDDHVRSENIEQSSDWWDARFSSEIALHCLEMHLNSLHENAPKTTLRLWMKNLIHPSRYRTTSDLESQELDPLNHDQHPLKTRLDETKARYLSHSTTHIDFMLLVAQFAVTFGGLVLTVVGYVGCFSLVQDSTSVGSVLWLVIEVMLSLLRMAVWASNPGWDDTSLNFRLKLEDNSPPPTCTKFSEELDVENVLPLTRSRQFLADITSFVGPLDPLEIAEDGVALYYTMTRRREDQVRVLYVTIYDYKENVSEVFICPDFPGSEIACRSARLNMEAGVGAVSVKMEEMLTDNRMTNDPTFRHKFRAHCNSIFRKLVQRSSLGYSHTKMTWGLQSEVQQVEMFRQQDQADLEWEQRNYDMWYLERGELEQHIQVIRKEGSVRMDGHISLVKEEGLEELSHIAQDDHLNQSAAVLYEAAVSDYLICYEWEQMQQMLIDATWKLEDVIWRHSVVTVAKIEEGQVMGYLERLISLKARISTERKAKTVHRVTQRAEHVRERLARLRDEAQIRIKARRYDARTKAILEGCWSNCEYRVRRASDAFTVAVKHRVDTSSIGEVWDWDEMIQLIANRLIQILNDSRGLGDDTAAIGSVKRWLKGSLDVEERRRGTDAAFQNDTGQAVLDVHTFADAYAHAYVYASRPLIPSPADSRFTVYSQAAYNFASSLTDSPVVVLHRLAKATEIAGFADAAECVDAAEYYAADVAWNIFVHAIGERLWEGGMSDLISDFMPDFTEFTQHARLAIDTIADPMTKTTTQGTFSALEEKLGKKQSEVQKRLRDEYSTMTERIAEMKDDRYDKFLPQYIDFKNSSPDARLALSKRSMFIRLPPNAMDNGTTVITSALGRNSFLSCVDCRSCSFDEVITIISSSWKAKSVSLIVPESLAESEADRQRLEEALRGHKNILALSYYYYSSIDIPDTWKQVIAQNRKDASEHRADDGPLKLVFYEFADIGTDVYKGYSYLGLGWWDRSSCTVLFSVPATGTAHGAGAGQLLLRLNHRLREEGSERKVNIRLNAAVVQWEEDKCPQGLNFAVQDIVLPSDALKPADSGVNELKITSRRGRYFLKDVPQLVWKDERGGETVW